MDSEDTEPNLNHLVVASRQRCPEKHGADASRGLNSATVKRQLEEYGGNVFRQPQRTSFLSLLAEGIKQPMIVLLLAIAVISAVFGRFIEATVMAFVVVAYVSVEFINKYRSSRTLRQFR